MDAASAWKAIKRAVDAFQEHHLTDWAAALTYYGTLSLFPGLIVLVSLLGLVGSQGTIDSLLEIIGEIGPDSAVDTFRGPIERAVNDTAAAGVALLVGGAIALWTASGYVGAFGRATNAILEVREERPFWRLRPLQVGITLAIELLLAIVLLAIVLSGPLAEEVGEQLGVGETAVTVWGLAKWPLLALVGVTAIDFLYWVGPDVRRRFRWMTRGSLLAVGLWVAASLGFAFYVANFGSYNETYGALGSAIVLLIWMYVFNLAVLLGAQLNALRVEEKAKD